MRMMMKVTIPVEAGNKAFKDGSLARVLQGTAERLKPEASYFVTDAGERSALCFFDMQDSSQIPGIAEPLFTGLGAAVTLSPVMNADDLHKGIAAAMSS
ncbi:MAG: hypothetical protein O2930_11670 [Acidobacteria bacterium]|nr:hypothetical protein [Acidobacteriota bacterium]